jgi:hypothetical protein
VALAGTALIVTERRIGDVWSIGIADALPIGAYGSYEWERAVSTIEKRPSLSVSPSRGPLQPLAGPARIARADERATYRVIRTLFPFAAWNLRRMSAMFTCAGGNFKPISSMVSAMTCETARLRNHL